MIMQVRSPSNFESETFSQLGLVRQTRALLWDALFVVVANKRSNKSVLSNEAYFESTCHLYLAPHRQFSIDTNMLKTSIILKRLSTSS